MADDVIEEAAAILAAVGPNDRWGDLPTLTQDVHRQRARALAAAGLLAAPAAQQAKRRWRDRSGDVWLETVTSVRFLELVEHAGETTSGRSPQSVDHVERAWGPLVLIEGDEDHAVPAVPADDETDYRMLADHVIAATNPPDDDVAEVSIVMDAVTRLAVIVRAMPCACPALEMGDDYCMRDACPRCQSLGRFADTEVSR